MMFGTLLVVFGGLCLVLGLALVRFLALNKFEDDKN